MGNFVIKCLNGHETDSRTLPRYIIVDKAMEIEFLSVKTESRTSHSFKVKVQTSISVERRTKALSLNVWFFIPFLMMKNWAIPSLSIKTWALI